MGRASKHIPVSYDACARQFNRKRTPGGFVNIRGCRETQLRRHLLRCPTMGTDDPQVFYAMAYHWTEVVTWWPDGRMSLTTGGWDTVTTQSRINGALPPGCRLSRAQFLSISTKACDVWPFFDGLILSPDNEPEYVLSGCLNYHEKPVLIPYLQKAQQAALDLLRDNHRDGRLRWTSECDRLQLMQLAAALPLAG